ncbi:MAG: aconitate hydratase AcnA, partial [Chloroflexi bacterium]|nr:aconitate hydratase AcnA [Chloroflexota bacterium]
CSSDLVERYAREQGIFRTDDTPDPLFTDMLELDLSTVVPSLAGPKRPQDRIPLTQVKQTFEKSLQAPLAERGFGLSDADVLKTAHIKDGNEDLEIKHGAVVIAAITSCTNTSNPSVMLGAGLVAKKAVEKGLSVPRYVKTSLAPGSRVVADYLKAAGVMESLEQLGFNIVGYGCTTCIGNSGPLPAKVAQAVQGENLVASAVLSGNRNFEGRISPLVKANFLASPPLVVAYALAGTTDIDLTSEPLGIGKDGQPVYLRDVWPTQQDIRDAVARSVSPKMFLEQYAHVREGSEQWQEIKGVEGDLYQWDEHSTYIQEPPFFTDLTLTPASVTPVQDARVLGLFGDSVTTDHISPAGDIALNSPAGRYLVAHGVEKKDFNSYGARRGNDRVLLRGTFANIRLKNLLVPGVEGGVTVHMPSGERMDIYDASVRYQQEGVPLVIIAGKEYGTGSSRDWAAKGTALMGVRAVIAESYERIHRNNLVGMGVLPLQFVGGQNAASLGLTGKELFSIEGLDDSIEPRQVLSVKAQREDGSILTFDAVARLDTPVEVNYYKNGGILPAVLRVMAK